MVEAHNNVSTEAVLDFCGGLRCEAYFCAVDVAGEFDAAIADFGEWAEREDLIAAAVGEYWAVPGHKFVESAELFDCVDTRSREEMVGIGQYDGCAGVFEVVGGDTLYGACGADGHKYRGVDLAVGGGK